ncbi:MAG TPA: ATP-binding cassette domain-containing protein, partial [Tissierellaceae bacterium]
MNNIIEIKNVTKTYKKKKALDNISLEVSEGKILGILGPNGSGKTTLIKLITGLTRPNSGEVKIDGEEPGVYTKS